MTTHKKAQGDEKQPRQGHVDKTLQGSKKKETTTKRRVKNKGKQTHRYKEGVPKKQDRPSSSIMGKRARLVGRERGGTKKEIERVRKTRKRFRGSSPLNRRKTEKQSSREGEFEKLKSRAEAVDWPESRESNLKKSRSRKRTFQLVGEKTRRGRKFQPPKRRQAVAGDSVTKIHGGIRGKHMQDTPHRGGPMVERKRSEIAPKSSTWNGQSQRETFTIKKKKGKKRAHVKGRPELVSSHDR